MAAEMILSSEYSIIMQTTVVLGSSRRPSSSGAFSILCDIVGAKMIKFIFLFDLEQKIAHLNWLLIFLCELKKKMYKVQFDFDLKMQNPFVFEYDPKWESVKFQQPAKKIIAFDDVQKFQSTQIYTEYVDFLGKLQKAISGKKISDTKPIQKFKPFEKYFEQLQKYLDEVPPIQQPMRYGNKAFKDWYVKATEYTTKWLDELIPQNLSGAKPELYRYIAQSFGSNVRIDYGTGHELSYMFFCWCLVRLGFCKENEFEQLVRQVFYKYVNTIRKVQIRYMLEPAGSHGVWGLDDYVFLPFLLGASQLLGHQEFASPECIHKTSVIQNNSEEYMYFNCVKFIISVKKNVPFAESSPILNNISGAANWDKITMGMIKMYKVEVLGKHPVIKHQYFGNIIPFK